MTHHSAEDLKGLQEALSHGWDRNPQGGFSSYLSDPLRVMKKTWNAIRSGGEDCVQISKMLSKHPELALISRIIFDDDRNESVRHVGSADEGVRRASLWRLERTS